MGDFSFIGFVRFAKKIENKQELHVMIDGEKVVAVVKSEEIKNIKNSKKYINMPYNDYMCKTEYRNKLLLSGR